MTHALTRHRWSLATLLVMSGVSTLPSNAADSEQAGWATDAAHTEINFSIKHFFTPVTGSFSDYEIDLDYNAEEPEKSAVEARIKVASIDTGNERRDKHLRTADWLEVDTYPDMTFKSTSVRTVGENQLIASGPLTIKGTSQEIELSITLLGTQTIAEEMQEMFGGTKQVASFQASTSIKRGDFGVGVGNWAATMVVGSKVDIQILLEAHRK